MTSGLTLDEPPASHSAALSRSRKRWYVTCGLIGAVVGGGLAYAVTPLLPTTYTAQSQVVVRSPSEVTVFDNAVNVNASTVSLSAAQLLRSEQVSAAASVRLGGRLTPGQVAKQVSIAAGTNSPVVTIDATASTGRLARDLANAVPGAYLDSESAGYASRADQANRVLDQMRKSQVDQLAHVQAALAAKVAALRGNTPPIASPVDLANYMQSTLATDVEYQRLQNEAQSLTTRIAQTDDTIQRSDVDFSILEGGVDRVIRAQEPPAPTSPRLRDDLLVGIVVGLVAGALIAWRATERRRAIDSRSASAALGAPLLGRFGPERQLRRFPRFADFSTDATPGNEFKVLTSSLLLSARRRNIGSILLTSAHAREGKSVLAANIAAAGEYTGHGIALVDASTGHPTLSDYFGLEREAGLPEMLDGGPLSDSLHPVPYTARRDMAVVPTGVVGRLDEPGRRLSQNQREVWGRTFSGTGSLMAVVDGPAVNDHPLPLQLSGAGVLVVVVSPRTTLFDLEVLRNRAEAADVTVLGFILNEFRAPRRRRPVRKVRGRRRRRRADKAAERRPLTIGAGS